MKGGGHPAQGGPRLNDCWLGMGLASVGLDNDDGEGK